MRNIGKATEPYTKLPEKYPDHEPADGARAVIKFFVKSPEDVNELEKMRTYSEKKINR